MKKEGVENEWMKRDQATKCNKMLHDLATRCGAMIESQETLSKSFDFERYFIVVKYIYLAITRADK